jgi:hypothetical protein
VAQLNLVAGHPLILADEDITFGSVLRINDVSRFVFTENTENPNGVRVTSQAQRNHILGIIGNDTFSVGMHAIAGQIDRDVALVLDRSGSMASVDDAGNPTGWSDGEPAPASSRWAMAAEAAGVFLNTLQNDTVMQEKVALVTYNATAQIDNQLQFDYQPLSDSIDAYTQAYENGWTNIADGIEKGRLAVTHAEFGRSWAAKTIVILTDGLHNTGSITPQQAANAAASQGITIHTITYGDDADQSTMQEVAAIGHGQHWHAPGGVMLAQVMQEVAANLPTILVE